MNRRHHRMLSGGGGGGEGTRLAAAAVVAAALLLPPPSATAVRSFGTGYTGPVCVGNQTKIFNHTVSDASRMGLMSHFWTTGLSEEAQAGQNYQLEISYSFDGEPSPSISFNPAEAMGQMHGAVQLGGDTTWLDGTRSATANTSVFAAGDKMGKNAMTSAWYNYYRLPFSSSVRVTASLTARPGQPAPPAGTCGYAYVIVRGHEISSAATAAIELPSGFKLPPTARMELQHTDTLAPLGDYVPLANVSSGRQALLYMVTLGLTASPPFGGKHETNKSKTLGVGHYVGGCWHLMRTKNESVHQSGGGMLLGTGLEDFFDSSYFFSMGGDNVDTPGHDDLPPHLYPGPGTNRVQGETFQHASAGILHFSSDYDAPSGPVERFSGYRFFDAEVVGVENGGQLGMDNGDANYITWPHINKCGSPPNGEAKVITPKPPKPPKPLPVCHDPSPLKCRTHVRSLVWMYTWPAADDDERQQR